MDSIEVGRQTAEKLHTCCTEGGVDPWNPMAIVAAVALARGIEITSIAPGSPLLAGARASYDPIGSSIQHEETGSAYLNAFLIAHELGHATLGDERLPDQLFTIEPERAAEVAPVGEERIADYSRRSRREVQMDLFARELLLPRAFVRGLHVEHGMSASAIAQKLGAPYGAVAQQMLDALLIPAVELSAENHRESPLNSQQSAAAGHRGVAFLLEAGPGTGKTKTLVGRLSGLIEDGIDPRSIVVLTYSNKAAGELAERIAKLHPEATAAMWIGTFHAFGLNLIRRFYRELGYQREPNLLDRTAAIDLMLDEVASLTLNHYRHFVDPTDKLRDVLGAVSRAQDEVVLAGRYRELVDAMKLRDPKDPDIEKCEEIARVYARYDEVKKSAGLVDFGDLVSIPVDLLERRTDLVAQLRAETCHILVDEYQDVNRASVRLLQSLTDRGLNLWCVGDVRQSIYRFRGASSYNLQLFDSEDFPSAKRGRLETNYRSTKEVVDAYTSFAGDMPVSGASSANLRAHRGPSGNPVEFAYIDGDADREMDGIADSIQALREEGYSFADQALLCSGNERLARIGAGLEARGIPVLYLGSLFERPEVKDLLAWISLVIDRRAIGLARGTAAAGFCFSLEDVAAISDMLRQNAEEPLAWIRSPPATLSTEGRLMMARYASLLLGLEPSQHPWEIAAQLLLDRTRIGAEIGGASDIAARAKGIAIWQVMNFLRSQPSAGPATIDLTLARIRRLVLLSDDHDLRTIPEAAKTIDAVRLMTMHGSKGLEFPVVHIPGMSLNTLPSPPKAPRCPVPVGMVAGAQEIDGAITDREHIEEQECLFYVALSRSRNRLVLYAPDKTTASAKRKPSKRQPSPFIERLGFAVVRRHFAPSTYAAEDKTRLVDLRIHGVPTFPQTKLSLYERCPRRFFYTHVLELGGRRVTSPYEDMHEVVRKVIAALLDDLAPAFNHNALECLIDEHWSQSQLASRPIGSVYRPLVDELVANFVRSVLADEITAGKDITFKLGNASVIVKADYISTRGSRILRQVRTGHGSSTELKGNVIACLQLAAQSTGSSVGSQVTFLADDEHEEIAFPKGALDTRIQNLTGYIANISAGKFEPAPSSRSCPKCPAFFACGPIPVGALEKSFT